MAKGNINCPFCGSESPYSTNRGFKCKFRSCGKKFTITHNTIFEGTKLPLSNWFFAMYQMSANKKNLSSVQAAKNLGISQKTAYYMLSAIRKCLHQETIKLSGTIEVDEAFISKADWHRWGSRNIRKTPVLGLIERGGKVIAISMENRRRETVIPIIEHYVEKGSTVYTDGFYAYKKLSENYTHESVNHSEGEFSRGDITTNRIENFWNFFKRNVKNPHHQISNKNLQYYLNEGVFKFNNRKATQIEKFNLILKNCIYG